MMTTILMMALIADKDTIKQVGDDNDMIMMITKVMIMMMMTMTVMIMRKNQVAGSFGGSSQERGIEVSGRGEEAEKCIQLCTRMYNSCTSSVLARHFSSYCIYQTWSTWFLESF